jgi:DeoR/GlpR family transcriptional regulator of sugar metabolism
VSSVAPNCQARGRGFVDGLRDTIPGRFEVTQLDGKDVRQKVKEVTAGAFGVHPEINVIVGVNDDSALGALDAYRAAGLDDRRLLVVSFGLEGNATKDLLAARGPFQAAVAMFPELVGRASIDASICAYHKCALPERVVIPTVVLTADDLDSFYQRDDTCKGWRLDPVATERLSATSPTLALLEPCPTRPKPTRVGLVEVFSSHEWYANVQVAMASRARDMGIRFEVIDASHDLDRELDHLAQIVGRAAAEFVGDGDTIILDSGKATAYLAGALHGRHGLTVITNSLAVLSELADEPGLRLISSGGTVRGSSRALIGRSAEEAFESLRANKAFITGSGLSIRFGLSHTSTSELGVKQAMIRGARQTIVLMDHTAVGVESLVKVAPLESIHRLITDNGISARDCAELTQRNVEVTIADG